MQASILVEARSSSCPFESAVSDGPLAALLLRQVRFHEGLVDRPNVAISCGHGNE
jgi:hypothetical protein